MKEILKARALDRIIKTLNPTTQSNTIIRATAVKLMLEGKTQKEISERLNIPSNSFKYWYNKYLNEGNERIEGLIEMEKIPIIKNRRDTSNDKAYASTLAQELKLLDSEDNPRALQRAEAILAVFKKEKTL